MLVARMQIKMLRTQKRFIRAQLCCHYQSLWAIALEWHQNVM
jgi:hypothetical protein